MDSGLIASLLQHPLRSAVVVLDADGSPLAANRVAKSLGLPRTLAAYAKLLSAQREQVIQHGGASPCTLPGLNGLHLSGWLRAVHDENHELLAFTLSIPDPGDSPSAKAPDDVLEGVEDWSWDCDLISDKIAHSERWRQMLGYAPKYPVASDLSAFYALIHPQDRERVKQDLQQYLDGGSESYRAEYRVRNGDGSWRWVLDHGRIVSRDADGHPLRLIGNQVDVHQQKLLELQLQEQQRQIEQMHRIAGIAAWSWDCLQDTLSVAPEFLQQLNLAAEQVSGSRKLLRLLVADSLLQFHRAWLKMRSERIAVQFELEIKTDDGNRHLQVWIQPVFDCSGQLSRLLGLVQNLTEQYQTDALIRWRTELLNRISALGRIGGCEIEVGTRRMQWTEECYRIHGLRKEPITLEQALALYTEESREAFEAALLRIADGGLPEQLELCFNNNAGQRSWVQVLIELDKRDGLPQRFVVLLRDISREREFNERIELLAHYDRLTGLPNRFLLREQAEKAMRENREHDGMLAMLLVDVDGFKNINDSFGHAIGDALLKLVADRLHRQLGKSDLLARFSDDEFVVVLCHLREPEEAGRVARELIASLAEPLRRDHLTLKVSASIGIALQDENLDDFDELLRAADVAMYASREAGRNTYHYYSQDVLQRTQRRLELEHALQGALDRDEFTLVYQPLINTGGDAPPAIEVLLRWNRPGYGFCSPGEFIPIAEECGEIVRLGDWVLREACRQAVAWKNSGLKFSRIAVNVSAVQLRDRGFPERVLQICEEEQWPSERLELELTESTLIRDTEVLRHCFDLFEQNGVLLAVDDFGTGFSNLHYLNRFPVQRLKIDRSFVQGVLEDSNTAEVTQAIVHLGHALGMQVVAEGVETLQEDAILRQQGCDEIQGYFYSCPLMPSDLALWLEEAGKDRCMGQYMSVAGN